MTSEEPEVLIVGGSLFGLSTACLWFSRGCCAGPNVMANERGDGS